MTYANKGTEFPDECARADLSDAGYRTHDEAIVWIFRVEAMDLRIPKHLVRRFAGSADYELAIKELVALGFWRDDGNAYVLAHHERVIRERLGAQLAARNRNRESQRAHRARKKAAEADPEVSADVSAYVIPDPVCLPATNGRGAGEDVNPAPLRAVSAHEQGPAA